MLKLKNITTKEKKPFLNNLSLSIHEGKIITITYKNPLEKNKLIDLLCHMDEPKSGDILVCGKNFSNSKNAHNLRKNIGFYFEDLKLLSSKSVLGNIIFPLELYTKSSRKKMSEIGEKFLKSFNLLDKKDIPVTRLSLEEKQRLALARALVLNPEFLIIDTPEKHMNTDRLKMLLSYIQDLNSKGKTILIFTTNKKLGNLILCEEYILEKGAISNV
jgi:ABC-type ATPase involved in cell division